MSTTASERYRKEYPALCPWMSSYTSMATGVTQVRVEHAGRFETFDVEEIRYKFNETFAHALKIKSDMVKSAEVDAALFEDKL